MPGFDIRVVADSVDEVLDRMKYEGITVEEHFHLSQERGHFMHIKADEYVMTCLVASNPPWLLHWAREVVLYAH